MNFSDIINFFRIQSGEVRGIKSEELFKIAGIPFTSPMLSGLLLTILAIIFVIIFSSKIKKTAYPSRIQMVLEIVYESLLDLISKITGDIKIAKKIMPIIIILMVYIAFSNILTMFPLIGSFTYEGKTLFSTNTSDLNSTFGIAATVVLWTHVLSIEKFNFFNHIFKFIKVKAVVDGFKKGIGSGFMSLIEVFIGFLDIISEFAKSMSLSLRLFGNMFAGEILTSLLLSVCAIVLPVILMFMGIFTGLLQALVFAALSASYFGAALKEE